MRSGQQRQEATARRLTQRRKDRKEKHLGFWVVAALAALRPACRSLDPPVESLWVEREALDGQAGESKAPVGT